jgi:hypothetical protein
MGGKKGERRKQKGEKEMGKMSGKMTREGKTRLRWERKHRKRRGKWMLRQGKRRPPKEGRTKGWTELLLLHPNRKV